VVRPPQPRPGPDLLSEAATRIGTTFDPTRTAREVTETAVPAFADTAIIFVSGPLLPGGHSTPAAERVTQALRQRGDDDITLVLARIRSGGSGSRQRARLAQPV
jgi:hypothetical protein